MHTTPTLPADYIFCGTRTGRKAHIASPTSSVTCCGHWLKTSASNYRLAAHQVAGREVCERCAQAAAALRDWQAS